MIELIGGEMPAWVEERPPAGGVLLTDLAGRLPEGTSVLVAGPHDGSVIDALAARGTVTCLVRSQPGAVALDHAGRRVLCGSLAELPAGERFDVVVALDGLDRLCSVEGPQLDWAASLRALTGAVRAGGTLLLAVENDLGVHRLVDPATPTAARSDDAWRPLGEFDTKPGNPTALADHLATAGLAVDWLAAAWPSPTTPTMIATPNALRDGPVDALAAAAAGAVAAAYADRSVLSDPRRLAATAVRAGLGPELAACWIVAAHRAPRPAVALPLPAVLLGNDRVIELRRHTDTPAPSAEPSAAPGSSSPMASGWLRHDPAGHSGPLPAGRLLEELLLGACLRHELPLVRRLLTGWIAAQPTATADNVVVHHDTFALLDPSAAPQPDVLRRFARTLLGGGYAHPWPAATDVSTLTAILHGAAGIDPPADVPDDESFPDFRREHEEQLRAMRRQVAEAAARVEFYEQQLDRREAELRKAHLQIAAFSGSVGYRVAKLGYGVARKARNRIRKGPS